MTGFIKMIGPRKTNLDLHGYAQKWRYLKNHPCFMIFWSGNHPFLDVSPKFFPSHFSVFTLVRPNRWQPFWKILALGSIPLGYLHKWIQRVDCPITTEFDYGQVAMGVIFGSIDGHVQSHDRRTRERHFAEANPRWCHSKRLERLHLLLVFLHVALEHLTMEIHGIHWFAHPISRLGSRLNNRA